MSRIREELRLKLDAFIRKYYQSKLLKGLMYFIGIGLLYFLLVSFLEYYGHFGSRTRFVLWVLLLTGLGAILMFYVLVPVAGLIRIGKHLSYEQAARIIGKHFPEVSDKITNTLELSRISGSDNALIRASIDQRIAHLNPVPFTNAVDFRDNLKYWPILIVPVLILLFLALGGQWQAISEGSKRIAGYNKEFIPEAPFSFLILNDELKVEQGEDFTIRLSFNGASLPESAEYISTEGSGRFTKAGKDVFEYTLENVRQDVSFRILANGFSSEMFHLTAVPVPRVRDFHMSVEPPAYTGIKPFVTEMKSVVDVPEGSRVEWRLKTESTDKAELKLEDTIYSFTPLAAGQFQFERRVYADFSYRLATGNASVFRESEIDNAIHVIKDAFPGIDAGFMTDSAAPDVIFYKAQVSDDYGFTSMKVVVKEDDKNVYSEKIDIAKQNLNQRVAGVINLDSLAGKSRDLVIFLEVWDNDGVNGAKASRSAEYKFSLLSKEEQRQQLSRQYESYFSEKENMKERSDEISKQMEALKNKLLNNKSLEWKDKQKIKEIVQQQQELLMKQAELEEQRKDLQKKEDALGEKNEEIREEEQKIEDIANKDKQDELEKLMEEINKLMDKLNMEELREKLDQMERMSNQNQRSQERIDELLKDLQFQKDVLQESEKLEELAQEMKELAKNENQSQDEKAKQDEIGKEFEESKDNIEKLKEENEQFAEEAEEQELEKSEEEATENMNDASQQLQKNQQQKANESQQKSGEKMQEMSNKMMMSMMQMQAQQHMEDMQTLRQILENLETLSFDVEELSELSKKSGKSDPLYRQILIDQRKLQNGAEIIKDSLIALSGRVPEIKEVVFEELDNIDVNLEKSIQTLEEQNGAQSAAYQQFVMTAANNLALLLDEALRNMQMQMANMMQGNQSCQKPGSGKPSLSNMKKMQGELAKQMGELKKGNKEGKGEGRNGKEIVEMLSRQEQIRRQLEDYMSENEGKDGSKGNLQKALDEMKNLEKDLVDGNIRPESLERIKEIETRLLESEKAELEQKQDEQRESKTAGDQQQRYEEELKKYLEQKSAEREEIFSTPLNMKNYYKAQSNQYLHKQ